MRILAALLCAGLATGPALASSTTIIDFTIEIVDIYDLGFTVTTSADPLLSGRFVGDTFSGILELRNPLVDDDDRLNVGLFDVEALAIDSFDAMFFAMAELAFTPDFVDLTSFNEGDELSTFFAIESGPLDIDVNNPSVEDILDFLTGENTGALVVRRGDTDSGPDSGILFDVISASVRPHTTPIPLPAAGWLMLAGLGGLAALRRCPA